MADETRSLVIRGGPPGDSFEMPLSLGGTSVPFDESRKPEDYDLLVLDGGSLTAEAFAKGAAAARTALEADKPVLVLAPTAEQKDVLAAAGALGSYPTGGSVALLIEPRRDADGGLHLWLAEQYAFDAAQGRLFHVAGKSEDADGDAVLDVSSEVPQSASPDAGISRFAMRVRGAVDALKEGRLSAQGSDGPKSPPANVPKNLYNVTPINLFWEIKPVGQSGQFGAPRPGHLFLEGTAYIGVYYDNKSFDVPVQWLLIQHTGSCYTNGMDMDAQGNRGWSLGALDIEGAMISDPHLAARSNSPNNVNSATSYTSSTSFNVGVGFDSDGISGSANYEVSSSATKEIFQWKILQLRPNYWKFAQQLPYDGSTLDNTPTTGNIPDGSVTKKHGVAELPTISTGGLSFDTQTVWQHLPATNDRLEVKYKFRTISHWAMHAFDSKWRPQFWSYAWDQEKTYAVNWAFAWPRAK